jgi:hypothetical protein
LEIHSGRTLANQGQKLIEAEVQSISATTHTYTILPAVSADGQLLSPLFIVLKESTGTLGSRVRTNLFQAKNLYISATKSGKMTKELFQTWLKEVFFPNTGSNSVLLLDSWTGHCPETIQSFVPKGVKFKVEVIPQGTTSFIQPLDVYGFRIWKNFVRRFSDILILSDYEESLQNRNNILKLQSLAHNQLSSPRFIDMFKYAWHKSGYVEEKPDPFVHPTDFCFHEHKNQRCHICGEIAVVTCAWCKKPLCLKHFFTEYHYCNHYEP